MARIEALRALGLERAAKKPAGGFAFITTEKLLGSWWAYREGRIRLQDLRVWLAAHEQLARRCQSSAGTKPQFELEELQALTGAATRAAVRGSLRRLMAQRLIRWGRAEIVFPRPDLELSEALAATLESVKSPSRLIPVPRRMLRLLAGGARRVLIATVFGHLIRCLFYRSGQCLPVGGCKASWVAGVFGVDMRAVKRARSHLVELGWLERLTAPQWSLNRTGGRVAIDLTWERPGPLEAPSVSRYTGTSPIPSITAKQPPPTPQNGLKRPPPESDKELPTGTKNQKPATRGSAGVSSSQRSKKPNLNDVCRQDLRDTARLLVLFEQACTKGLVEPSEHGRLQFVGAAEHARSIGSSNPCGLLAHLVRRGLWHYVTQDDEDSASRRLKKHLFGAANEEVSREVPRAISAPVAQLSRDARLVKAARIVATRVQYRADPFYLLKREHPEWTRIRWNEAVGEIKDRNARRGLAKEAHTGG